MEVCSQRNLKKRRKPIGGLILKIPSRSTEFKPIENVFNLTAKMLNIEAVEYFSLNFQLVPREH